MQQYYIQQSSQYLSGMAQSERVSPPRRASTRCSTDPPVTL